MKKTGSLSPFDESTRTNFNLAIKRRFALQSLEALEALRAVAATNDSNDRTVVFALVDQPFLY